MARSTDEPTAAEPASSESNSPVGERTGREKRRRGRRRADQQLGILEQAAEILGLETHDLVHRAAMLAPGGDRPAWLGAFERWSSTSCVGLDRVADQTRWIEMAPFERRLTEAAFPELDVLGCYREAYAWEQSALGNAVPPKQRAEFLRQWVERASRSATASTARPDPSPATTARETPAASPVEPPTAPPVEPLPEDPAASLSLEPPPELAAQPSPHPALPRSYRHFAPDESIAVQVPDPQRLFAVREEQIRLGPHGGFEDGGWIYEWQASPEPGAPHRLVFDGKRVHTRQVEECFE